MIYEIDEIFTLFTEPIGTLHIQLCHKTQDEQLIVTICRVSVHKHSSPLTRVIIIMLTSCYRNNVETMFGIIISVCCSSSGGRDTDFIHE